MKKWVILLWFWGMGWASHAQSSFNAPVALTLPSVGLLDVEPLGVITLTPVAPTEAGDGLGNLASNATKWLNFTSAVPPNRTRRVTVQLSSPLPTGLSIRLTTSAYQGTGAGALGVPQSPLVLTSGAQTLIQNVGGAFTGNGINNGYNLVFSVDVSNFGQLRGQDANLTLIYTLLDN